MYALQPPKKTNPLIIILAVIGGIFMLLFACVLVSSLFSGSASVAAPHAARRAVYKVTTTRDTSVYPSCVGFDVTYEMPSGTAQKTVDICDGAHSVTVDDRGVSGGDFVYLSVQNGKYSATTGCEIWIDGKLAYQTRSEGQYVIASCSGSAP
jgi:hypothetical protein